MAFPTTGLVSYWKLEESSGTRVDSHGTNHLTPTNAPVGAAGKLGNGCDFESSSAQYLSCASNASLQTGDIDFTFTVWAKLESEGSAVLVGKDTDTGREYTLHNLGPGAFEFYNYNGGAAVSSPVTPVGSWYFVVAWYDATANTMNIQVNNGAVASVASAAGPNATDTEFRIGSRPYPGFQWPFDGIIDEVGFWKRVLTAQERTDLYNGGAGLAYAPPAPPVFPTANLVSYWRLDEASGTRQDSHGTNHLTPTNAPVGAAGKIGNGCDFESSSSQYLSHADPTPLGDEDFTYTLWFKVESVLTAVLLAKHASQTAYQLLVFDFGPLRIGLNFDAVTVNSVGAVNDLLWHFAVWWHDATANTLNLQVDNGTVASTSTGGVFPNPNTVPVSIGSRTLSGDQLYFDGLIDEVGLWRRVLTAQERTDLYNGGAGLAYSTGATYGGDLTTRFVTYLANLRTASPGKDLTTLVAKDLPVVRAAHQAPTELDDANTLYFIHLD